jgi:phosphoserine phosphatase
VDWYANTELIWNDTDELVDFIYHIDQAVRKVEQFNSFKSKYAYGNDNCLAIGDGDSDIKLFQEIRGIAVNKESYPELEALALRKISELKTLKEIL